MFILFFINFNIIYSFILGKYDSIETNFDSILFDSKDFFIGDKMEFKFKPTNYCDDILYYGYYDDSRDANVIYETPLYVSSLKEKNNNKILYFTIVKNEEELNGLDGNYVLLKFNCDGSVEIKSINPKSNIINIIIIVVVCLIVIIIIIVVIIICCIYKKKNENGKKNEENNIDNGEDNNKNKNSENNNINNDQEDEKSSDRNNNIKNS